MHRSGTSLVASMMEALSVQLGDHLIPADSHNQLGYFEDVKFVRFHQRILSHSCVPDEAGHSDWGWTESERLDVGRFSEFRDQAQRLLVAGNNGAGLRGWKDPRTTLFLDFWDSLLEDGRFVFVYRFPWDVADSMQRLGAEVFLRNPEYAYRIWTFYNTRLRDFYARHSDRCLLVSINALQNNLEQFVALLSDKLGLPTEEARLEEIFKPDLFKTIAGEDPLIDLVAATFPGCAQLLSELDDLADISGACLWHSRPVRSRLSRPDAAEGEPVDLSIITPCYEQGTLLLESIASAERHAPPRCELIIINDGSTQPRTVEILELLKRCGYFVIDQENAGLSAARNKAIQLAQGRYILALDDDNRIRERFLAEAVGVLDSSPEVGIVYGDRYDFGLRTGIEYIADFDLDKLLDGNYIDACAVFRKQVWSDCQGYDLFMSAWEDWEFWIHAAEQGWRFHHIPRVTFEYRVRPSSLVSQIDSEKDEELRRRVRAKHVELYWGKALRELEVVKGQLAEQTDQQNRLKDERDMLVSQLAEQTDQQNRLMDARDMLVSQLAEQTDQQNHLKDERDMLVSQLAEQTDQQNRLKDERGMLVSQLEVSKTQLVLQEQKLQTLSAQLADREARIERITSSMGWRLLSHYGRIKYRYLLPLYRAFGEVQPDRTKTNLIHGVQDPFPREGPESTSRGNE